MSSMTPEGKVKAKIDAILKKYNVYYFKPRGTGMGRSGIPDYVCCFYGHFIAIEAKTVGKGLTALQTKEFNDIADHHGIVVQINEENLHVIERLLDEIQKRVADAARRKTI